MSTNNLPILTKPNGSASNQVTPVPVEPTRSLTIQTKRRMSIIPPPIDPLEQLVCVICMEESIPPHMLSDILNEAYTSNQSLPRVLILLDTYLFFDLDSLTSESATIPPVDDMFCSPYVEMDVETITELITTTCQESILSTRLFFIADDLTAATETLRKVEVGKTLDWQSSRVAWRDANVVAAKWTRGYVSGMNSNACY
ncbi:hypothetical protein CBS63078_7933 [Aspergillus niger]|uniref:Major Facilitator Superfamily protein n=2 Tax=Aspergillus niger TaxID=5061 RepID=A0A254UDH4_ASPNG|nr:hypothetical protein ASPNIDRAFT_42234 [Aspergillus niger ATCC 1015]KAI2829247.1 hypothetical protein CBS133816_4784 [Aspergillus niger]KAI2834985.1 hypothetical protein CBS11350_10334 [Aspergillus niger]KAI2861215.1 hypothetical protein CBS12448_4915 [Aspergillus niger]KAI2877346.1 hypothetical protein CBS13152_9397 [Aspergillus niger]